LYAFVCVSPNFYSTIEGYLKCQRFLKFKEKLNWTVAVLTYTLRIMLHATCYLPAIVAQFCEIIIKRALIVG
jgi:hypothetical protein